MATTLLYSDESPTDKATWQHLQKYAASNAHVAHLHESTTLPTRTQRLARCRTVLVRGCELLSPPPEIMLMVDLDDILQSLTADSILSNFRSPVSELQWAVLGSNNAGVYIDRWALRTFEPEWLPYDVWACEGGHPEPLSFPASIDTLDATAVHNWCVYGGPESVAKYGPNGRLRSLDPAGSPIPVLSAFGGAALYDMSFVSGCDYGDGLMNYSYHNGSQECEHVAFHRCIRRRHGGKIFINPAFILGKFHGFHSFVTLSQVVDWFWPIALGLSAYALAASAGGMHSSSNKVRRSKRLVGQRNSHGQRTKATVQPTQQDNT